VPSAALVGRFCGAPSLVAEHFNRAAKVATAVCMSRSSQVWAGVLPEVYFRVALRRCQHPLPHSQVCRLSILYSLFCWRQWAVFSHVFLSHEKVAFVVHQGGIPIKNLVVDKSSVLLLSVLFLLNKTNGYVFFVGVSLWWYRLFSGAFEFSEC